ncbi:MAG: hypothetical protein R3F13_04450 [Prosthecobacter sp.]
MGEDSRPDSSSAVWGLLVVLPLAYLLSIGPAVYFMKKLHASSAVSDTMGVVYAPVLWLYDNTSLHKPLDRYANWWEELADRP